MRGAARYGGIHPELGIYFCRALDDLVRTQRAIALTLGAEVAGEPPQPPGGEWVDECAALWEYDREHAPPLEAAIMGALL